MKIHFWDDLPRTKDNRMLMKLYGPTRRSIGDLRKLHKKKASQYELLDKYYQDDKITEDEVSGHVICMEEKKNTHGILVEEHEVKRLLRKPRCRQGDNIKINLKQIR